MDKDKSTSLDELLANFQQQYEQKKEVLSTSINSQFDDSIDNFCQEIESKIKEKKNNFSINLPPQKSSNQKNYDDILEDIKEKFSQSKEEKCNQKIENSLIDNLTQKFEAKKQKDIEIQQQEKLKLIQQDESNKQRKEKELIAKAEKWLKTLDVNSDEGFWFEQFAYAYPTKMEAAIEYLKALS